MRCPHCQTAINPPVTETPDFGAAGGEWCLLLSDCPECKQTTVRLRRKVWRNAPNRWEQFPDEIVFPRAGARPPAPPQVEQGIRDLYDEASRVFNDSPRAAGALLRRALQQVIREKAGITRLTLDAEITDLLASKQLPLYLADIVDGVRVVGNFAAHPIKSKHTGEILEVEDGEVDLSFDVLEALFDFYYIEPERVAAKKAALNDKLQKAGKPPLK